VDVGALFVFSPIQAHHRQKHSRKIVFFFSQFLSNLKVKSSNTKIIENTIYKGITYWFLVLIFVY